MHQAIHLTDLQAAIAWNVAILLAAILAFSLQWSEGRRRNFEPLAWLTVLAVTYAALLVGERAGAFTMTDWSGVLTSGSFPAHSGKTLLGGLVLAILAYLFLKKWWCLPRCMSDALVLAMPLAAAVVRLGCLAAGCCFGSPTGAAWGLSYGAGASAFDWQVAQGLIPPDAAESLPVFPVQLFFTASNLLIFALAWRFQRRLTRPGSLALLVLGMVFANRFWLEFFREATSNRGFLGETFSGVKVAQWVCLAIAAASLAAFWWNQRPSFRPAANCPAVSISLNVKAGTLLAVALGGLLFSPVLTFEEEGVLVLACAPALFFLAKTLRSRWSNEKPKSLPAALFSAAALTLLATPLDTFPPMEPGRQWIEMGGGFTTGAYDDISRDCDGNIVQQEKIKNNSLNFEGSYNWGVKNGRVGLGLRGSSGATKGAPTVADKVYKYNTFGGYVALDKKAIGLRPGILFVSTDGGSGYGKVLPTFNLRVGKLSKYHIDYSLWDNPGFGFYPEPVSSFGIANFGFGDPSGAKNLRLALSSINGENAFSLSFRSPIGNIPLMADGALHIQKKAMFSLGLRYRFDMQQ